MKTLSRYPTNLDGSGLGAESHHRGGGFRSPLVRLTVLVLSLPADFSLRRAQAVATVKMPIRTRTQGDQAAPLARLTRELLLQELHESLTYRDIRTLLSRD